jgi:hypothetical protein
MRKFYVPAESLTEEEARQRQTDCEHFAIFALYDGKESRRAIFVWRTPGSVGGGVLGEEGLGSNLSSRACVSKGGVWR